MSDKKDKIEFIVSILMIVLSGLFMLESGFTGFFIVSEVVSYSDDIGLSYSSNTVYNWFPDNIGELQSVSISGRVIGNGTAKVYIDDLLIFDSLQLTEENSNLITALAVDENIIFENTTNNENATNENNQATEEN